MACMRTTRVLLVRKRVVILRVRIHVLASNLNWVPPFVRYARPERDGICTSGMELKGSCHRLRRTGKCSKIERTVFAATLPLSVVLDRSGR